MRFYLTIVFIVSLLFEILAYVISIYREKLNNKFIESRHDFLAVICHHLLAFLNVALLVISFLGLIFYTLLLLTLFFSLFIDSEINLNPILNIPFSIMSIIFIVLIFIIFEILVKKNEIIKMTIDRLSDVDKSNNDEQMGISGNLRYIIIVYVMPLTILLFLINLLLGVE